MSPSVTLMYIDNDSSTAEDVRQLSHWKLGCMSTKVCTMGGLVSNDPKDWSFFCRQVPYPNIVNIDVTTGDHYTAHTCHQSIMKTPPDGVENAAASDSSCMFTPECSSRQSARRWRECGAFLWRLNPRQFPAMFALSLERGCVNNSDVSCRECWPWCWWSTCWRLPFTDWLTSWKRGSQLTSMFR